MNYGKPSNAIELLEVARPYELGFPASDIAFVGSLYPVYVRGLTYLTEHRGAKAAAEFQKILDHRGIVFADPIGALAHLQLGRAFALSGDMTKGTAAGGQQLVSIEPEQLPSMLRLISSGPQ